MYVSRCTGLIILGATTALCMIVFEYLFEILSRVRLQVITYSRFIDDSA